jgi:hypothetical protein
MKQKEVTFLKKTNQKTFAPLRAVVETPMTKNK